MKYRKRRGNRQGREKKNWKKGNRRERQRQTERENSVTNCTARNIWNIMYAQTGMHAFSYLRTTVGVGGGVGVGVGGGGWGVGEPCLCLYVDIAAARKFTSTGPPIHAPQCCFMTQLSRYQSNGENTWYDSNTLSIFIWFMEILTDFRMIMHVINTFYYFDSAGNSILLCIYWTLLWPLSRLSIYFWPLEMVVIILFTIFPY